MRYAARLERGWRIVSYDLVVVVAVAVFLGVLRPLCAVATAIAVSAVQVVVTLRVRLLRDLALALVVGFVWAAIVNTRYGYAHASPVVFGVNVYASLAWGIGLFGVHVFHDDVAGAIGIRSPTVRLVTFTAFYWSVLVGVEYLAYHFYGIHNLPTGDHQGLPGIDCLHAPRWMQVGYFLLGPAYVLLARRLSRDPDTTRA